AADGPGEDHAVLRSGLGQVRERGRRTDDLEPASFEQMVDLARDGDRERKLAASSVRSDQAQEEQQALLHRNLAAALVHEIQALGRAVENDTQVGPDGGN